MKILYEDNHILVVEKPPNIPVQADSSGDIDMLTLLKAYIKEKYNKPGSVYLGLVHRLDRPVGGVMVFARTSKAAERLTDQFTNRQAKKEYVAIVEGEAPEGGLLSDYIVKDVSAGTARIAEAAEPGAKAATLRFTRMGWDAAGLQTLLHISLMTGRKHQIRLQLSSRGWPILHDQRYNPHAKPGNQICLWAYALSFTHPTLKTPMEFFSLPAGGSWAAFAAAITALPASDACYGVYADDEILVVAKSAGVEVAAADGDKNSLEARLTPLFGPLFPVHRLDANTLGLVLFARTRAAEAALLAAIEAGLVDKRYLAVVVGGPEKEQDTLTAYLKKDAQRAMVTVFPKPVAGAKEIITGYRVLKRQHGLTLLEIRLYTGRTHQIRAHLRYMGWPVLGDDRYGDREMNRRYKKKLQMLLACRLTLRLPEHSAFSYLENRVFLCPFTLTLPPPPQED